MPDIRPALPVSIAWRKNATADPYITTTRIGAGTTVTPNDPIEEFATGFDRAVGVLYDLNIEVKDPALFAQVNADMRALETYEFLITYTGSRTVLIQDVGFQATKLRQGAPGIFEGFVIVGVGYGQTTGDILTLTPVIT